MKQRYFLCLLLCGVMLYYEIPNLTLTGEGIKSVFSIMWLLLALLVVAGNLAGILYSPKRRKLSGKKPAEKRKRIHYYQ